MKKVILIVLVIIVLGGVLFAAQFYWNNLRGAGPAFSPPPADIADLIDNADLPPGVNNTDFPLDVPDGFKISVFARDLGNPRVITHGINGDILVSIPDRGQVLSVRDASGDGAVDTSIVVASGLRKPHGILVYCDPESVESSFETCDLYVAEEHQLVVFDLDELGRGVNKRTLTNLPTGGRHTTRTIMEYEGEILVSIGSSCDVCREDDARRGAIIAVDPASGASRPFADGLRNSVFLTRHPVDGAIWATDMGRDQLGDDLPPDEINIVRDGSNYGWPICYGKNIHDTDFDKNTYIRNPCEEPFQVPSHIDLQAHSAPLGLAFFPEEGWPEDYWFDLLVSYHGSWNRTEPTGYKLIKIDLDQNGNYIGTEDFITGWLTQDGALGRPVDILIEPGGTIFVSDDKAGVIYRITYSPEAQGDRLSGEKIRPGFPVDGDVISSPVTITGEARGNWFFEASFPVTIQDANGNILAQTYIMATDNWMTEDFVPYSREITFDPPSTDTGFVILHRDNPSGLPEYDESVTIPVRFNDN